MRGDLPLGVATFALSAGYYFAADRIPDSRLADAIGPAGLPKAYAVLLATLSLGLIGGALKRQTADPGRQPVVERVHAVYRYERVIGMLAIGIAYIVLVPWLGYLLSVAALLFTTMYCQGSAADRRAAIVALSGAVFCWILFVLVMRIEQPPGLWPSLL